jgi:cell fate (sporulation/competence/biofilm development) regulator YlbF (YheA/YmcA/DUF963 family)
LSESLTKEQTKDRITGYANEQDQLKNRIAVAEEASNDDDPVRKVQAEESVKSLKKRLSDVQSELKKLRDQGKAPAKRAQTRKAS